MYSRFVAEGSAPVTFGVSGRLWHGVLVMTDRESDSLWTQLDGRAIQGEALGKTLEHVPSTFTTWEAWKRAHPATLVLEKPPEARERVGSNYAEYFADPDRLFMDRLGEGLGGVGAKDVVFGVVENGEALAVTEGLLREKRVVNAVVGGTPVAWLLDERTGSAVIVERRLGQRLLLLDPAPENPAELFKDSLTDETHGADELRKLRSDRAFWYAWRRTHPKSVVLAH